MSFADLFADDVEPEPEPEPPVAHGRPDWLGPPAGELGVAVPLGLVLGRADRGGIAASHALVHSTGVLFELVAHVGGLKPREANRFFHEQHTGAAPGEELPDGYLRFGLELADGTRVSNLVNRRRLYAGGADEPAGPVLVPGGGGGGQSSGTTISWQHSLWLWPLPPPGRLTVYCEWPVARIGLTRTELDTAPLLAAAPNAVRLWHDEEPSAAHGIWASAAGGTSMTASPEPKPPEADEPDRAAELDALERALTEALRAVRRIR